MDAISLSLGSTTHTLWASSTQCSSRDEEERNGLVRWLRPDYQNPSGRRTATQGGSSTWRPSASTRMPPRPR
jgi:hypothetical protein